MVHLRLGVLLAALVVVVALVWSQHQEVLEQVGDTLGVQMSVEVGGVTVLAVEVRADVFLVSLEEGLDHLREVAEQHGVDLLLLGQQAEQVVEVLLVVAVLVHDQHLRGGAPGRVDPGGAGLCGLLVFGTLGVDGVSPLGDLGEEVLEDDVAATLEDFVADEGELVALLVAGIEARLSDDEVDQLLYFLVIHAA